MSEEYVTAAEARAILGVSKPKMSQMLKDGTLPYTVDKLDKRRKWVRKSDVASLRSTSLRHAPDTE